MKDQPEYCPKCGHVGWRETCDVWVGVLMTGPLGCPNCGWSEDARYDISEGPKTTEPGGIIDQLGGVTPDPNRDPFEPATPTPNYEYAATQGAALGAAGGELLPCPFCGDAPDTMNDGGKPVFVRCVPCGITWKKENDWNTRAPSYSGGSLPHTEAILRTPVPAPAAARDAGACTCWMTGQAGIAAECAQHKTDRGACALDPTLDEATSPPSAPVARYGTPNNEFLALQGYITEENPGFVEFLRYAEGLANRYDAIRAEVDFCKTDADHWRKAFEEQRGGEAFITTQSSLVKSRAEVARLKETDQMTLHDLETERDRTAALHAALATTTARIAELEKALQGALEMLEQFANFKKPSRVRYMKLRYQQEILLATRDGGTPEAQFQQLIREAGTRSDQLLALVKERDAALRARDELRQRLDTMAATMFPIETPKGDA